MYDVSKTQCGETYLFEGVDSYICGLPAAHAGPHGDEHDVREATFHGMQHTIAKLRFELASARAQVEQLPECFDLSNFVRAGLSLENATIALMASRRILEDAERAREKELKAE